MNKSTFIIIIVLIVIVIAGFFGWKKYQKNVVGGTTDKTEYGTTPSQPAQTGTSTNAPTGVPTKTYTSQEYKFSVLYPSSFRLKEDFHYDVGPKQTTKGVAFVIPQSLASGTNLGSDSYVSVETASKQTCTLDDFLQKPYNTSSVTDNGTTYQTGTRLGAAAGNRYEEIVFSLENCRAIRYFIHSANIQNFDPGSVRAFNRDALISLFDVVRHSYKAAQ